MIDEYIYNKNNIDVSKLIPGQSIDCVIIGFDKHELKILLLKWKNTDVWTLPGGFIHKNDDMDTAAIRILKNRTGLEFLFLEQFYTFGNCNRGDLGSVFKKENIPEFNSDFIEWLKQRFITTGYLSLVDIAKCHPVPDMLSDVCEWKSIDSLPKLIFDHEFIVKKALASIKIQINYLPIGISLLPEKFTMKSLRNLYESILDRSLDRGNFQKKILKLKILNRHEKQMTGAANKAPFLYSFDKVKYQSLLDEGIGFFN
jgi:ADP-ribose pyrophosphatase YjhB (NUDIX family)